MCCCVVVLLCGGVVWLWCVVVVNLKDLSYNDMVLGANGWWMVVDIVRWWVRIHVGV